MRNGNEELYNRKGKLVGDYEVPFSFFVVRSSSFAIAENDWAPLAISAARRLMPCRKHIGPRYQATIASLLCFCRFFCMDFWLKKYGTGNE
jgi:hypothetical protein